MVGYALTAVILEWGFSSGKFTIPGGDALIWDRVGDEVRAGISPYYYDAQASFYYAPPWAVLFAALSWLPVQVTALMMIAAEVAALRYIAGSWLRVGWCLCLPLVAFELPSSQLNLLMAAAIAAALRADPRAAVVMTAAKLSPILAIDPRQWRGRCRWPPSSWPSRCRGSGCGPNGWPDSSSPMGPTSRRVLAQPFRSCRASSSPSRSSHSGDRGRAGSLRSWPRPRFTG